MSTQTLKEFLENRLRSFDSTIDLSAGSPAQEQIVTPTVNRFTPDPFEMTTEKFIDARLAQEFPEMNIQEGTGVRDFVVKPDQAILDPVIREVTLMKKAQSLQNPDQLADSEVDALVANLFVGRNPGDLANGKVRLYFNSPIAVRVTIGNVAYTASGLRYLPNRLQSISAETMLYNQSGSLFYFDIDVQAEMPGDSYNIGPEEIIGITNINVAVRATNLAKFEGGLPEETSEELVSRAQTSVTERSLVVPRGVNARLRDQFPSLEQIQVIGFGDSEMQRDLLTGGDLGESIGAGNDGYAGDDGLGGRVTTKFATRFNTIVPAGYGFGDAGDVPAESPLYLVGAETKYGSLGRIDSSDHSLLYHRLTGSDSFTLSDVGLLVVIDGATNQANNGQFRITQVSSTYLKLANPDGTAFNGVPETGLHWTVTRKPAKYTITHFDSERLLTLDPRTPIPRGVSATWCWSIHRREVSVSMIPSGVTLSSDRVNISVQSGQVHLGGCSDFYVRGASTDSAVNNLDAVEDESPLFEAKTGRTLSGQSYFFWDRPNPSADATSVDFVALGVSPGDSLVVTTGPDAGARTILRVGFSNGYPTSGTLARVDYGCLQVDRPFTSTQQDLKYKIVKAISINLRRPTLSRGSGSDGQTIQGNKVFTTAGAVDFVALGVVVGDVLKLTSGVDAGEFTVTEISGTGNKNLILSSYPTSTSYSLSWEVLRVQSGLKFPLVRVSSVQLLDSSRQVTGKMIPRSEPVAAVSTAFSNIGRGVKLRTTKAIVGIWGRINADTVTYPIVDTAIHFVVDGGPDQVADLNGAATEAEVIRRINALVDMDGTASVERDSLGVRRLSVRSATRWIYVSEVFVRVPSCDFGLESGDDNRQVTSTDPGLVWSYPSTWTETEAEFRSPLVPEQDSVQVLLADGTTRTLYLKQVSWQRMLVLDFDTGAGAVRFPTPTYGTTLTVGTRSSGKARVYFTDPTTFEVRGSYRPGLKSTNSVHANLAAIRDYPSDSQEIVDDEPKATTFSATVNGVSLRFIPDPTLSRVVVPSPEADIPNNLSSAPYGVEYPYVLISKDSGSAVPDRQAAVDFLKREVRPGDRIEITFVPIIAVTYITETVLGNLVGKELKMRLDGAVEKTLTFTDQLVAGDTSKHVQNLVNAINDFAGSKIAYAYTVSSNTVLRLEADFSIVISPGCSAGTVLGWSATDPTTNESVSAGIYDIDYVGTKAELSYTTALLVRGIGATWTDTHFKVIRPGGQRVHATTMNDQMEHGLYYADIELVSDGSGDIWNIPEGTSFVVTDYDSDGYRLEVLDPNLSFSTEEDLKIVFSKRVLFVGQSDDPEQATSLAGQNIQISYDYSSLAEAVQDFASANLERVVCASLLVRHLLPSYLYFTLLYQGGSSEDVVTQDVHDYLAGLGPDDRVQASSVQDLARRRGATYVKNPLTLVAVGQDAARKQTAIFSDDYVTHGRLSTFFPGNTVVTKG